MNKKAKYTALSRETCPENRSIVGEYNEDDCNDNKIRHKLVAYAKTDAEKGFENAYQIDPKSQNFILKKDIRELRKICL